MFDTLSLPVLLLVFAVAAAAVWIAGSYLSDATDILSSRWELTCPSVVTVKRSAITADKVSGMGLR